MEEREMSLVEFVATLPKPHRARRELDELMRMSGERMTSAPTPDGYRAMEASDVCSMATASARQPTEPTPLEAAAARIAKFERQISEMSDNLKAAGATLVKFRNLLDIRNDQLRDASTLLSAAEIDGGKLRLRFLETIRWCEHRDKLVAQIARSRDEQP